LAFLFALGLVLGSILIGNALWFSMSPVTFVFLVFWVWVVLASSFTTGSWDATGTFSAFLASSLIGVAL
jgi:hypothetical protein